MAGLNTDTLPLVCQTLTSVKGTLCCAAEVIVSTLRAASSVFAPRDTRSPPMGRPAWVSDGVVPTSSLFFASVIFVSQSRTGYNLANTKSHANDIMRLKRSVTRSRRFKLRYLLYF